MKEIPGLGVPMLALNAPQTQHFSPINWYNFTILMFIDISNIIYTMLWYN